MKYGINLLLWTVEVKESHHRLLEQVRQWGYHGVELPVFSFDEANFCALGQRLDALELQRTAVTICTEAENPISADASIRRAGLDRLKRALEMSAAAGAELLCGPMHSALGVFTGSGPSRDEWQWGLETMMTAADYAQTLHVTLALEFLNRFESYFLTCTDDCLRFVREANHPHLHMMYDTFHGHIEEKDPAMAIRACGDQLIHLHISENDRSTPGTGTIPWDAIAAAIRDVRYDGWLTVEAFGTAIPELAAATKIWRRMFTDESQLAREALTFLQRYWPQPS